jgi:predicted dehydrogenase
MGSNHIRVLHELQEEGKAKLIGVADINENLAIEVTEKYGVDWFTDHKKLLNGEPDFVVVAEDVARKGCHILVGKPIAHTISARALEIRRIEAIHLNETSCVWKRRFEDLGSGRMHAAT